MLCPRCQTQNRPGAQFCRQCGARLASQIALDLLTDREVEAMVGSLLGARHVPAGLVRQVQGKAEGNPLFVEEITTSLREGGLVRQSNGGVVWASDAAVELPGTVQDIIRARLDRLDDPVKRTVQTAAVIGRQFGLNLLRRVSERSQAVHQDVESLKRLELVHETRFFPELEYIFKHAVIQDVAYQSLLGQRRKELHGAIASAIEDLYADRLENQAPILAYHYARSAHGDQAIKYAFLAGDRAARLYAHTEATSYYEQALVTARALPLTQETQRAEIDAAVKLATVAATRQDIERDQGNLERARALSEGLPDQPRLAQVLYWRMPSSPRGGGGGGATLPRGDRVSRKRRRQVWHGLRAADVG